MIKIIATVLLLTVFVTDEAECSTATVTPLAEGEAAAIESLRPVHIHSQTWTVLSDVYFGQLQILKGEYLQLSFKL